MEKKIFMYSQEAVSEYKFLMKTDNPLKPFIIYIVVICTTMLLAMSGPLWAPDFIDDFFDFLSGGNSAAVFMLLWEIAVVVGFVWYMRWMKTVYWAEQIAFIKDQNTFYAVKVTYLSDGNPLEVRQLENEMKVLKTLPMFYEEVLDDILFRLNTKDEQYKKPVFLRDLDKNFKLSADGIGSIIRLDEVSVLKKEDKYLYLSYKDYKGKKAVLKILSAYPNLEEEIRSTNIQQYDDRFPGNVKIDYRMMRAFYIVMAVVFWGFITILRVK